MITQEYILKEIDRFAEAVMKYDSEYRRKNKLPKNHELRPYRWCSRDIVFSLLVVKHERYGNYLYVDVCLIANPSQYYENSGARVAMGFLLSEAYKCGTTMEIVFGKNIEPRLENGQLKPRVPAYICDLAIELEVSLKHVFEGHISPFEARQMYMGLAGFSKTTQEKIMKLSVGGKLTPERVCFLVMGGLWSLPEAEALILGSAHPEDVLMSASDPALRHVYLDDLLAARGAVLGGVLDRKLLKKELVVNGQIVESEDEENEIAFDFDEELYAKIYKFGERLEVPWVGGKKVELSPDINLAVLVRSRTSSEILESADSDLEHLGMLAGKYKGSVVGVLYPRDWEEIQQTDRGLSLKREIEAVGAHLMMSPESVAGLDKEAMRRLETGRMVRHE